MEISVEQKITIEMGDVKIKLNREEAVDLYRKLKVELGMNDWNWPYQYPYPYTTYDFTNPTYTFPYVTSTNNAFTELKVSSNP